MHAVFFCYGRRTWVEEFLKELESQKLVWRLHRKNPETGVEEERFIWWRCQVRTLVGGMFEVVFPKEHEAVMLTALGFHKPAEGHTNFDFNKEFNLGLMKIKPADYLMKFLRIEPIPKFDSTKELIFEKLWVSIIPVGVRYEQEELMLKEGEFAGWWTEAL